MYRLLHKNLPFHAVILLGLLGYFFFTLFSPSAASAFPGISSMDLFLMRTVEAHPWLSRGMVVLVLILQLILLQVYFHRNRFFETFNLLPSILYVALLDATGGVERAPSLFFANLGIILLLLLNSGYQPHSLKNQVFASGFIIGVLFFIDFSAVLLLLFVMGSLLINRFAKVRDILLSWLGFAAPLLYTSALYLFSKPHTLDNLWPLQAGYFHFYGSFLASRWIEIAAFSLLLLFLLYAALVLTLSFSTKLIIMRRRLISINMLAIASLAILSCTFFPFPNSLAYLFVPVTVYGAVLSQQKKNWLLNDLLILLLFILLCL